MVKRAARAADTLQQRHAWVGMPVAVWKKFGDDQAGNLAALVAYYAFFVDLPAAARPGHRAGHRAQEPPGAAAPAAELGAEQYPLIGQQLGHIGPLHQSGLALVVGLVGTFIGARGVATAMQNALNTVWEIPFARRPGFPWSWLRSFGLVLVIGLGLIGTTVLSTLASGGADRVIPGFGGKIVALLVSLVLNVGVFWLAFRLGTAPEIGWRQLRLGAVIAAVIWQILQYVGGYFISHQLAHASPVYGTFAVVIGLLAWLYLQAELTLYAVEINVVRVLRLWPRSIAPPPYTEQDRRAFQLYTQVEKRGEDMDAVAGESGSKR